MRSATTIHAGWVVLLAACGASSAETRHDTTPTAATPTPTRAEATQETPQTAQQEPREEDWEEERAFTERLIPDSHVDRPGAEALPVTNGTFTDGDRFAIHHVPPGVTIHRVGQAPATWEIRDEQGRRLALIQSEEWSHAMAPSEPPDVTAPLDAAAIGQVHELEDWGGSGATVQAQQYVTPLRLFRFERRVGEPNTDWIVNGFEYRPPSAGVVARGD